MRKHCHNCNKITRHKYKYIGREDSNVDDDGALGCLMIIMTGGLWLIFESFFQHNTTKLYDRSCPNCGYTKHGVRKH